MPHLTPLRQQRFLASNGNPCDGKAGQGNENKVRLRLGVRGLGGEVRGGVTNWLTKIQQSKMGTKIPDSPIGYAGIWLPNFVIQGESLTNWLSKLPIPQKIVP